MLFLTHIMLFSGVISMICLLWKEYKRNEAEEILVCLLAFATLGVSGMTALILYWVYSIYWYDMVFQAGIFLYTSILFWHLLQKTSRDSQFRMEQLVYEKMSMEDRMTGLKNRKAFEKYRKERSGLRMHCFYLSR
jgi:diguanylate cyclase